MRNAIYLLVLCFSLFSGCSRDADIVPEVVDIPTTNIEDIPSSNDASDSYDIIFTAISETDGDLLDPDYHWNLLDEITIEYKGEIYTLLSKEGKVRSDLPIPFKISLTQKEGENYQLNFGAFSPDENYKNETFTIDWYGAREYMDGYKDVVTFNLYTAEENGQTIVYKGLSINDKPNPAKDKPFLINKLIPMHIIYDFVNYSICFEVTNKAGENLLDPNVEGNILNQITITHHYKKYNEFVNDMDRYTRATYVYPLGMRIFRKENPILAFGEFSPTVDYRGETFQINWGDGTSDYISFNLYINWEKGEPVVYKSLYLNSILYSKDKFDIIKIVK